MFHYRADVLTGAESVLIGAVLIPAAVLAVALIAVLMLAFINLRTSVRPGASDRLITLMRAFGELTIALATAVDRVIRRQRAGTSEKEAAQPGDQEKTNSSKIEPAPADPPDAEAAERPADRRGNGGRQTEATTTTEANRRRRRRRD